MTLHQSFGIRASVGAQPNAMNMHADVEIVQRLLNEHASRVGYQPLTVNGIVSTPMIEAIKKFQKQNVGLNLPDGRVDPNGVTLRKLNDHSNSSAPAMGSAFKDVYSHPDAAKVLLSYGPNAVKLNAKAGSGVKRIIPKGVMNEPVDHVEFTFPVTG